MTIGKVNVYAIVERLDIGYVAFGSRTCRGKRNSISVGIAIVVTYRYYKLRCDNANFLIPSLHGSGAIKLDC